MPFQTALIDCVIGSLRITTCILFSFSKSAAYCCIPEYPIMLLHRELIVTVSSGAFVSLVLPSSPQASRLQCVVQC